ncbi:hypothetical protein [Rhodosalinus sediminis]|uniref:hypothetical protein n=1 Tax=Rhodosalinus sediminis TaxID=1940533 RepID=UPI002354DAB5|nr:hypothetical protein [Rhodosalinus sediminis]
MLTLHTGFDGWAVAPGTGAALAAAISLSTGLDPDIVGPGAFPIAGIFWLVLRQTVGPARRRPEDA